VHISLSVFMFRRKCRKTVARARSFPAARHDATNLTKVLRERAAPTGLARDEIGLVPERLRGLRPTNAGFHPRLELTIRFARKAPDGHFAGLFRDVLRRTSGVAHGLATITHGSGRLRSPDWEDRGRRSAEKW
jgi:hypothetical protein